jgi:WD40 repeat protein
LSDGDRLRRELRNTPLPGESEARERGWRVVRAAFAEQPVAAPRSRRNLRLGLALAGAAAIVALVLTPAGAKVVDAFRSVTGIGGGKAEPALTSLPTPGGRVLVSSAQGPWVVSQDGSKRLLGDYGSATWSPRGLFVAAAEGHQLAAVDPTNGDVHWTLDRPDPVRDPAWSPSGYRIAYLSGNDLRIVDGSGSFDHGLVKHVAHTAPAWEPLDALGERAAEKGHEPRERIAYADRAGRIHLVYARTGQPIWVSRAGAKRPDLLWSQNGGRLAAVDAGSIQVLNGATGSLMKVVRMPRGDRVGTAAMAPSANRVALAVSRATKTGRPRSLIETLDLAKDPTRRRTLVSDPGAFTSLAFSPDGRWLLAAWRDADQWLFIPLEGGKVKAVGHISQQFAPGTSGPSAFPRVDGWCCGAGG